MTMPGRSSLWSSFPVILSNLKLVLVAGDPNPECEFGLLSLGFVFSNDMMGRDSVAAMKYRSLQQKVDEGREHATVLQLEKVHQGLR